MAKKSKRLSAKRVIALITAFLFVLSGMPLSSISAQAAVKKPTIAKSATLKVGTSKTIKISKGSYKIVSVKVSSSKKSVATVKASGKAAIKVTGKKAGKATITTRVKAKKGKTSKTFKLTTKVTVKKATKPEPTVDTSKTVNTQDELVAALADSSITQITIGQDATSITIPAGDYSKVDLIVDAPNASITNNGVFKSVTIKAIAANTWIEKAKGNRITSENEGRAHIVLAEGARVAAILVSSDSVGGITIEVTSGSVANLTITGTEKVNLVLSGAASVGTVSVEAASKVDIAATGSSTIEKVEVTEKAAGTATDKTVVNVKAEGSAEIKEITTSAANSTTNVTANGSADVAKVAVNGSADASIGGTSNKVTEVDIKGASKDAVVTVTTTTVKIEAAAGTDNEKIINNQSGKALTTEVTQSDGTKKETTTATDTTTPSSGGGSTGGGSGSSAVSVASVTISGQAKVGGTLTATYTPANPTNITSRQWQIAEGNGENDEGWSDITGATGASYKLTAGDAKMFVRLVVNGTIKSNVVGPIAPVYTIAKPSEWNATEAHGDIAFSASTAAAGEEITVTATPADGYGLEIVTVNYSTSGVILVGNTATFTMRAENVTVGAIFVGGEELISLVADKITGLKSSSQIEALTTVSEVESELTAIADAKASFEALTSDQQASVAEVSSVSSKLSAESVTTVGGLFTALTTACNDKKLELLKSAAISAIGTANTAFSSLAGTSNSWTAWTNAKGDAEEAIGAYETAGGEANATNLTGAYTTYAAISVAATDTYAIELDPATATAYGAKGELSLSGITVTKTQMNGESATATDVAWSITTPLTTLEGGAIADGKFKWTADDEADTATLTATVDGKTADLEVTIKELTELKLAAISAIGTANAKYEALVGTSETWGQWTTAKGAADDAIAAYVAAGGGVNATNLTDAYTTYAAVSVAATDTYAIELDPATATAYGAKGELSLSGITVTKTQMNGETATVTDVAWSIKTPLTTLEGGAIADGKFKWTADDEADTATLTATVDGKTADLEVTIKELTELKLAAISAIGTANAKYEALVGTSETWGQWTTAKGAADEAIAAYVAAGGVANATNLTDAYTTFTTNSAVNGTDVYDITVGFNTPQIIDISGQEFNLDGNVYVTKFMYNGTTDSALSEVTWTVKYAGASVNASINGTTVTWTKGEAESDTIVLQASVANKTAVFTLGLETPN